MMAYKGYVAKVKFDDEANILYGEVIDLRLDLTSSSPLLSVSLPVVAYTFRSDEIRLISVRRATRREGQEYEG